MFKLEGVEYKSKSACALKMLGEGKGRMEISNVLGITYQTVHAIMKKAGIKPAPRAKKATTDTTKKVVKKAKAKVKHTKKTVQPTAPVAPVAENVVATNPPATV